MKYRERILQSLSQGELPKADPARAFVLTHTHDESQRQCYLRAPYTRDVLNVLIAYIQFQSSDLEDVYGMDQTEMVEILCELYDCEAFQEPILVAEEIDLYLNWEEWCGLAEEVQSLSVFSKERLTGMLQKNIDSWNAEN